MCHEISKFNAGNLKENILFDDFTEIYIAFIQWFKNQFYCFLRTFSVK
jgi:hypothetical protein